MACVQKSASGDSDANALHKMDSSFTAGYVAYNFSLEMTAM